MRVVVISDMHKIDAPFYDSHAPVPSDTNACNQGPSRKGTMSTVAATSSSPSLKLNFHAHHTLLSSSTPQLQQQSQSHQKYAAEIPNFHCLQDRVFGYSQMKYSGPVTKLHPLPLSESPRRSSNADQRHRATNTGPSHSSSLRQNHVWLVSRIFRLSRHDQQQPATISTTSSATVLSPNNSFIPEALQKHLPFGGIIQGGNSTGSYMSSISQNISSSTINHSTATTSAAGPASMFFKKPAVSNTAKLSSSPRSTLLLPRSDSTENLNDSFCSNNTCHGSSSSISSPSMSDYNVAICVFITVGPESQSSITDYWEELNSALLQLQSTVSKELFSSLPLLSKEFVPCSYSQPESVADLARQTISGYPYRRNFAKYLFTESTVIRHAIDTFKSRFFTAVREPRVICGQRKWPEILQVIRWILASFGSGSTK